MRVPGSDGLELHLLRWSSEGIPMLLLHGFSNEAHIWDDFAPKVAPYYQVIAMDLRGHGDSDWDPEHRYEYSNHLADLESVVGHLGFERVVLVGHSLGGRVCIHYAGKHPDRVAGLVIVDSAPELDRRGILRMQQDVGSHPDPTFRTIAEYERYLAHAYPAATSTAVRRMARHGLRELDDGRFALKMDVAFRDWGNRELSSEELAALEQENTDALWSALSRIPCPTLVVRGAASDFVSADVADRMVEEELENGELVVVPQAGHSVMTDNPEGFNQAVTAFVLGD